MLPFSGTNRTEKSKQRTNDSYFTGSFSTLKTYVYLSTRNLNIPKQNTYICMSAGFVINKYCNKTQTKVTPNQVQNDQSSKQNRTTTVKPNSFFAIAYLADSSGASPLAASTAGLLRLHHLSQITRSSHPVILLSVTAYADIAIAAPGVYHCHQHDAAGALGSCSG